MKKMNHSHQYSKGLEKENPILVYSIASGYVYLDALCRISKELEYRRIGPVQVDGFPEVVDHYVFICNGIFFCELYIYAYHHENQFIVPAPFQQLDAKIDESIFELNHAGRHRYLCTIAEMVLTKNGIIQYEQEVWGNDKQHVLSKLLNDLGYEDELEKLILNEYKEMKNHYSDIQKYDFIRFFTDRFHNKKLAQFTPVYIQDRNKKILNAYNSIIETIHRIQGWLNNEKARRRIEITTLNSSSNDLGFSAINYCITPFCFISLGCDAFGRFNISYGIDSRILNIVTDNMASTLLRRIYEFTPGEMEPFVGFVSLNMDCISYFENTMNDIDKDNYQLIEVKRHEEESIADLLSKIELKDDVDEETKKWFNR
jgi:hypothetical protein